MHSGKQGKMQKALVKTAKGYGNVEVRSVPVPELPREGWVLIRIHAAGICGTDIHVWEDKFQFWPPVILGHEFSGEIVEIGKNVKNFKVGDRVVAEPHTGGCGLCPYCRSGRMHLCKEKLTLGWRIDGVFTDYITLPELVLHRMPDRLSYQLAALCEPLAIAIYDVAEHGKIELNDFVVVQGSGPIGMLCAYVAKMLGAAKVLLTGIDASEYCRFGVAEKLGADYIVNVQQEDLPGKVAALTDGKGADVVIESSGAPSAIAQSADLLKRNGRLLGVGIPAEKELMFPWKTAVLNALEIYCSMSSSYTSWDRALDRLQKDGDILKNVITNTARIDDWEDSFRSLLAEKDAKVVFTF